MITELGMLTVTCKRAQAVAWSGSIAVSWRKLPLEVWTIIYHNRKAIPVLFRWIVHTINVLVRYTSKWWISVLLLPDLYDGTKIQLLISLITPWRLTIFPGYAGINFSMTSMYMQYLTPSLNYKTRYTAQILSFQCNGCLDYPPKWITSLWHLELRGIFASNHCARSFTCINQLPGPTKGLKWWNGNWIPVLQDFFLVFWGCEI